MTPTADASKCVYMGKTFNAINIWCQVKDGNDWVRVLSTTILGLLSKNDDTIWVRVLSTITVGLESLVR